MISHTLEGHTAVIVIDNPPANTWTPESLRALEPDRMTPLEALVELAKLRALLGGSQ